MPPQPKTAKMRFQSTRPVRGGTGLEGQRRRIGLISIHPPRAGRDFFGCDVTSGIPISIHPPRAGRDEQSHKLSRLRGISIHPPRAGRDGGDWPVSDAAYRFQSTRPVRGGTTYAHIASGFGHFNPPAPCGAGRWQPVETKQAILFQSTRPVRGGTIAFSVGRYASIISIHPPRAGRDVRWWVCTRKHGEISIHPPRAGRDLA